MYCSIFSRRVQIPFLVLLDSRATHKEVQFGRQIFRSAIWTATTYTEEIVELLLWLRPRSHLFAIVAALPMRLLLLLLRAWVHHHDFNSHYSYSRPHTLTVVQENCVKVAIIEKTIQTMLATAKDGWLMSLWHVCKHVRRFGDCGAPGVHQPL